MSYSPNNANSSESISPQSPSSSSLAGSMAVDEDWAAFWVFFFFVFVFVTAGDEAFLFLELFLEPCAPRRQHLAMIDALFTYQPVLLPPPHLKTRLSAVVRACNLTLPPVLPPGAAILPLLNTRPPTFATLFSAWIIPASSSAEIDGCELEGGGTSGDMVEIRCGSMAYELYNDVAMHVMDRMNHIQEILQDENADHVNNLVEVLMRLRDKLNTMDHILGPRNQDEGGDGNANGNGGSGGTTNRGPNPIASRTNTQAPWAYDMQEMQNLATEGPMPFETLRDQSWFMPDTLLNSRTKTGSKRITLCEINTLRMRIGLMGIPAIRLRDWHALFPAGLEEPPDMTSIISNSDPLSQFDKIVDLRSRYTHSGSLKRFALDTLEALLVLVETASYITREDVQTPISPTFEHILRSRYSADNTKHPYDGCSLSKEITATTHWLNSYFYWGPVVVLAPPFFIDFYRSTVFSKRFGHPEIDIWIGLCDHQGCTPVDDRKIDAIHALDKLMRVAFDHEVAGYARGLAVQLHSYDVATRRKRRHGHDRNHVPSP
ncbi:uncharacterized protein EI90DRAFT_3142280 [Cantharellus anzutake]|uniref:uncharacterized protein n=1 Tax=Cantharellus anzutake TaxID=1750568 RepID=UPI001908E2AA|nr:uncharacterized protein EI90DRAFT_3142280 [Cantharellus anzutake]KAF8307648.1 hypothetical protein EI90DRAFT_3142280 [Cantharellus anzutake]